MKKLFSILLTLALVLTVLPMAGASVFAAELSPADGDVITSRGGILLSGTYQLKEDIKLQTPLYIGEGETVDLYLNGNALMGAVESSTITVLSGATLNLYDKADTEADGAASGYENRGKITSGEGTEDEDGYTFGGGLFINEDAEVNVYGGSVIDNIADYGAAIYNLGELNIYNCLFEENLARSSAIILNDGKAVIDGTLYIRSNTCEEGGGTLFNRGSLSMGGSIYITDNTAAGYCGGIMSMTAAENFVLTGGYYEIENNTIMEGTPADLMSSFWGEPLVFTIAGEIDSASRIGLFSASEDFEEPMAAAVFESEEAKALQTADLTQIFFSNNEGYKLAETEEGLGIKPAAELVLTLETPVKYSGISFDKALSKRVLKYYTDDENWVYSLPEGNYVLTEDIIYQAYTEGYSIVVNGNTNILLNGHNIELEHGASDVLFEDLEEGTSLALFGEGNITGFGLIAGINGGKFTLNGGSITDCSCYGYGLIHAEAGLFEMNGGYIGNNTYYNWSSAVWIDEGAEFAMYGGKIADNRSNTDPCGVIAYGNVTLGGSAVINGNSYEDPLSYEDEYLASNLVLHGSASITISKENPLKGSAKIGITKDDDDWDTEHDGGIVSECYNRDSLSHFFSDDTHVQLKQSGNGAGKYLELIPYKEISVDTESQYAKLGSLAKFALKAEPAGLGGYTVSYSDAYAEAPNFKKGLPDSDKEGLYIVKIERAGDGTYAPVKLYSALFIGEECTLSYDISSADSGETPEKQKGIKGQNLYFAAEDGIEKKGYEFAGWEYSGEIYDAEWYIELDAAEMTVKPAWDIKIAEQPSKSNNYTVVTETESPLTYQWQKRQQQTVPLADEYIEWIDAESEQLSEITIYGSYFNMDMKDEYIKEGDSISFECDADLVCYSEDAGELTEEDGIYTYTFLADSTSVRIENTDYYCDEYTIYNCTVTCSLFKDAEGETESTLKDCESGAGYRCLVADSEGRERLTDEFTAVSFADVCEEDWFAKPVYFCTEKKLFSPKSEMLFSPLEPAEKQDVVDAISAAEGYRVDELYEDMEEGPISRQDAIAMFYTYEAFCRGGFEGDWMFLLPFEDADQISAEAYEGVAYMTMKGVIEGDNNSLLRPEDILTRGELAKILMGYVEMER